MKDIIQTLVTKIKSVENLPYGIYSIDFGYFGVYYTNVDTKSGIVQCKSENGDLFCKLNELPQQEQLLILLELTKHLR